MSLGEVWWFFEGRPPMKLVLEALGSRGLDLRHPESGDYFLLEASGDRRRIDPSHLADGLSLDSQTAIQLWVNSSTDVLVALAHSSISLDLDGLTWAEAERVAFAVVSASLAVEGGRAVVVDRELPDQGESWVGYFNIGGGLPYTPDLLMTSPRSGSDLRNLLIRTDSWLKSISGH
jgi:hypothetical protein